MFLVPYKEARLYQGSALTMEDTHDNLTQKEVTRQVVRGICDN